MQDGLVLLDKPAGRTSFEALRPVKRGLASGKVGHAGTLDRFATGLLILLTGKLTRLIRVFSGLEKHYVARVRFGVETETLDPEGEVTRRGDVPNEDSLRSVLAAFTGDIVQVPPAYSAVHVNGARAYRLARDGETPDIKPRTVTVHSIDLRSMEGPEAVLDIRCGSGTYVRSLARDIAYELGTVAHLTELRRTAIGDFGVDEAGRPDDFVATRDVIPADRFVPRLPAVRSAALLPESVARVAHGAPLSERDMSGSTSEDGFLVLFTPEGGLAGAAEKKGERYTYLFVSVS